MGNNFIILLAVFLIIGGIVILFTKDKVLDFRENLGGKLYSRDNRKINNFRAWFIAIFFIIFGLILMIKFFLNW